MCLHGNEIKMGLDPPGRFDIGRIQVAVDGAKRYRQPRLTLLAHSNPGLRGGTLHRILLVSGQPSGTTKMAV